MVKITKKTQVCVSIAEHPGHFGAILFNAAFQALSLDFIYKPFQVNSKNLKDAVKGLKTLGIRGCGVSMPHKTAILPLLDRLDPLARKIGAVNTIVNDQGRLKGYNTDFIGAKRALEEKIDTVSKTILIIGAGGAARALVVALQEKGASSIFLTDRHEKKGKALAREFGVHWVPFKAMSPCDLLINATPVGMAPHSNKMIVKKAFLASCKAVMDVVNMPFRTLLLKTAEKMGKTTIPGYRMTLYQAAAQFELYTGQSAPLKVMEKALASALKIK